MFTFRSLLFFCPFANTLRLLRTSKLAGVRNANEEPCVVLQLVHLHLANISQQLRCFPLVKFHVEDSKGQESRTEEQQLKKEFFL